ncbi:MAG: pitrilysin family protein [Paracoccus sp. (in: a-proteobacteria)]|uniref:M16 family metallopeptidase n=1 Tax=Paracoccus sp. TaxID=267 RepID=UPI0026DF3EEE|nr:pitrilysin family protein [Paracoccus sp. (in: a-proteobacteria)]MDO5631178.1 pitrilysin family protein [Paracoccus sp. (in: a-proteobacteria)]
MRAPLAVLTTLALTSPALAEMPEGISHFTLPNGLETVVIQDHRAPVVVQMLWYKIGSADEPPGKSGIAHYLEHLMFKGTDTLAPGEFSRTVTRNGGMDNAFTSYDYTAYFQRIAADRLPLVMEMESDRMANLRIGEDDWQAERQVVLEERAQRTDSNPRALFAEESSAVQFYNHPYGRPVIGWRQEMEGLTRDDAIAWYDDHYSPNEAILILAGDVTPEQARELAEQYYGPIPPKGEAAPRIRPQEPQQRSPRRMEMTDPRVPQPVMTRTIIAPERNAGDQTRAAALTVLSELLGGNMQTSVLGRELAMTGKALWVGTGYDGLSVDPTTFAISMVPADGMDRDEAEAELNRVLARFVETGPDAEALERVKTQIRAARIYAQDSAHGRAYDYGQGLSTGLTIQDVNDWPDILAAVTANDVMTAARDLLSSDATVTGWLLPATQPEEVQP